MIYINYFFIVYKGKRMPGAFIARLRMKFEVQVAQWHGRWCKQLAKGSIDAEEYREDYPNWDYYLQYHRTRLHKFNIYPEMTEKNDLRFLTDCCCSFRDPYFDDTISFTMWNRRWILDLILIMQMLGGGG